MTRDTLKRFDDWIGGFILGFLFLLLCLAM